AYLTVFGSIIAYSAYTYALAHIRMTTLSLHAYVNPIVAVILGWLVLHERLTWVSVAAMAIILAGMAMVQFGGRRAIKPVSAGAQRPSKSRFIRASSSTADAA